MRRFIALLLCSLAFAAPAGAGEPCPRAPTQLLSLPATRAALAHGRKITVIAFGSSSTEGSGASGPDRAYPAVLEGLLHTALPEARLVVLNRGRGGEEVEEMMARLETDVIATRPTMVIWQAGANAVLRGMAPAAFHDAMADGIDRLRARGIDVVLMDSQRAPRIVKAPHFERFDEALRDLSARLHVPLFSRAALMAAWEADGTPPAAVIGPDGLHHNDRGYACLAGALAQAVVNAAGPPRIAGR
ncbi:SGNH/GDSL hydrolase family protein [Belnapia sp. T6]|uniref:SGNH/GDSL hydrolase family protein n=1 Tax=Belnapia mucosa TaxID=2804532 RepID=A0ABS1V334_9PROT|nr:SGNH/GDSL hydrolase family protein [Belnapia mucosa]MBL6455692.1 SGNH/GDSL hydrolase family protein [Belnapia mucosa]